MTACALGVTLGSACPPPPGGDAPGDDDGHDGAVDCEDPAPQLAVGTGSEAFEGLEEGGEVTIWRGPQGGWHVYGSLVAAHLDPFVDIWFSIHDVPSATLVSEQSFRVQLHQPDECHGENVGMLGIFDPGLYGPLQGGDPTLTPCDLFAGHALDLRMEVTEALTDERISLADEVRVTAVLAEDCWPEE